jgi:hypothetical protein
MFAILATRAPTAPPFPIIGARRESEAGNRPPGRLFVASSAIEASVATSASVTTLANLFAPSRSRFNSAITLSPAKSCSLAGRSH